MANEFYRPGEARAAKVQDLFAVVAGRYDLINDLQSFGLHRLWKRKLLRLAQADPRDVVLDLCCGTGDVALAFARRGNQTVGLDFSEPMLTVAQQRNKTAQTLFLRGDALALPFADSQFDVVTISYGLRNLADCAGGLREMCRVTKPGGRLLVLDFGKPQMSVLRASYFAYLKHWVPVFGRLFCRNAAAYSYIFESLMHYPAQEGVAKIMKELGCGDVRIYNLLGGVMSINFCRTLSEARP